MSIISLEKGGEMASMLGRAGALLSRGEDLSALQMRSKWRAPKRSLPRISSLVVADSPKVRNVVEAKHNLLRAVQDTERGFKASSEQKASIEEAMVEVEKHGAGSPLDLTSLDGTWMLQYTTAADVISILQAADTPFFQVGQIFQKFECRDSKAGGLVRNVVRWSVPGLLQDNDGATLTVTADFTVVGSRNIALRFEEASIGSLMISEQFEAFINPATLPRTFLNMQVLQFFRGFNVRAPLSSGASSENRKWSSAAFLYYLSFLDNDMLLGRAIGNGGSFVFSRTQPLQTF